MTQENKALYSQNDREKHNRNKTRVRILGVGIVGLIAGIAITTVLVIVLMPGMMIVTKQSRFGFEETVTKIEQGIPAIGWASPGTTNMNKSMAKHGVEFVPRVHVIKMCKPEYAKEVLKSDRYVSCLMPCSVAVWESDDGKVYVSKMNTGLMGKMFGGTIAEVMGNKVSRDEHKLLNDITM
ncbi:DUF302 domain-containing protein [bacterium]|nr:DUF302 domain-containing protein [bacterium]